MLDHSQENLTDICNVNDNSHSSFVGIKFEKDQISINFPLGYNLSSDIEGLQDDVRILLRTLSINNKNDFVYHEADTNYLRENKLLDIPISSYMLVIEQYFESGEYYKENYIKYEKSKSGKINWSKTIKDSKAFIQNNGSLVYMDYITVNKNSYEETLLTNINKLCLYLSLEKIGWLYGTNNFVQLDFPIDLDMYKYELYKKLHSVNKEIEQRLFNSMIKIIEYFEAPMDKKNKTYGTDKFEYIWEKMIDTIFGNVDKTLYYPTTNWSLITDEIVSNSNLFPDTIMSIPDNLFILDAKYYRYGVTGVTNHLPDTSSIHKQITYAENIWNNFDSYANIFNIFIIPYLKENDDWMKYVGFATSSWKDLTKTFEYVHCVLLDTKTVMNHFSFNRNKTREDLVRLVYENIT